MCKIFLKFNIENDLGDYLALNHPNAFMLLYFIARRARRISGQADGLEIGECHIGDHKSYGLSEQQYRTAKKILVSKNVIQIVETCRNRKKSTTGTTTIGTLVRLLDSKVWDINPETINDRINDRPTTDQRPTNDRPTTNKEREEGKKEKKEKEVNPQSPLLKIKFREFVELSQKEFDSLLSKNGADFLKAMLDILDSYKGSTGTTYKSDYHTLKEGGWVVERAKKDLQKAGNEKSIRPTPEGTKPQFTSRNVIRGGNPVERDQGVANE